MPVTLGTGATLRPVFTRAAAARLATIGGDQSSVDTSSVTRTPPTAPRAQASLDRFTQVALERLALETGDGFEAVRHAYEIGTRLPEKIQRNDGLARGYVAEELGREKLAARYPGCHVGYGVELRLRGSDRTVGEVDGLVVRDSDGRVVALAEIKANPSEVNHGVKKLRNHLANIQNGSMELYRILPEHGRLLDFDSPGPYSRERFASLLPEHCLGITTRESNARETALRLDVSHATIARIAALLVARAAAREQKSTAPGVSAGLAHSGMALSSAA